MRELADVIAKTFSFTFEKSQCSDEVPADWKKEKKFPDFKKERKDTGIYRLVSLTSVLRKIVEQILMEVRSRHIQHKGVI